MKKVLLCLLIIGIIMAIFSIPTNAFASADVTYQQIQDNINNRLYDCYTDSQNLYDSVSMQNTEMSISNYVATEMDQGYLGYDDLITQIIPKEMFMVPGIYQYVGKTYGFYVNTFIEGNFQGLKRSYIVVFGISEESDEDLVDSYISEVRVEVLFFAEYFYYDILGYVSINCDDPKAEDRLTVTDIKIASTIANIYEKNQTDEGYQVEEDNGLFFCGVETGYYIEEIDMEAYYSTVKFAISVSSKFFGPKVEIAVDTAMTVFDFFDIVTTPMVKVYSQNITKEGQFYSYEGEGIRVSKSAQIEQNGFLVRTIVADEEENEHVYSVGDSFAAKFRVNDEGIERSRLQMKICVVVRDETIEANPIVSNCIGGDYDTYRDVGRETSCEAQEEKNEGYLLPQSFRFLQFVPESSCYYDISCDGFVNMTIIDENNVELDVEDGIVYLEKDSQYTIQIRDLRGVTKDNVLQCSKYALNIGRHHEIINLNYPITFELLQNEEKIIKFTPASTKAYDFTISESLRCKLYNEGKFLLNEKIGRYNALLEKDCSYYFVVSGNDEINSCTINIVESPVVGSTVVQQLAVNLEPTFFNVSLSTGYYSLSLDTTNNVEVFLRTGDLIYHLTNDEEQSNTKLHIKSEDSSVLIIKASVESIVGIQFVAVPIDENQFCASFDNETFLFVVSYTGDEQISGSCNVLVGANKISQVKEFVDNEVVFDFSYVMYLDDFQIDCTIEYEFCDETYQFFLAPTCINSSGYFCANSLVNRLIITQNCRPKGLQQIPDTVKVVYISRGTYNNFALQFLGDVKLVLDNATIEGMDDKDIFVGQKIDLYFTGICRVKGNPGIDGALVSDGVDGEDGADATMDSVSTEGISGTNGQNGVDGTNGYSAFVCTSFSMNLLEKGVTDERWSIAICGGDGGNGSNGGNGGNGGDGGNGITTEYQSYSNLGSRAGNGGRGGNGGNGGNAGYAINCPSDNILLSCAANYYCIVDGTAGNGGNGGNGGDGGISGIFGGYGSTDEMYVLENGTGGMAGAAGTGGTGAVAGQNGIAGQHGESFPIEQVQPDVPEEPHEHDWLPEAPGGDVVCTGCGEVISWDEWIDLVS